MFLWLVLLLVIAAALALNFGILPFFVQRIETWRKKKEQAVEAQFEKMFYNQSPRYIVRLYFILPAVLAVLGAIVFKSVFLVVGGILLGLFIPNLMLKLKENQRRSKFNRQILDMIMVLSSSLKGGLSLMQAFEVVVEELPAPLNQEIGLVIREVKMGLSLEESLRDLNKRMKMDDLALVTNSILVARETGGDLTKVFSRLATTIRDNRKLKDSIKTLTLQGRMQGIIMSVLPFVFVWWVLTFNRQHFDIMLESETGRTLLFVAAVLQVVGMILIKKFSTIRI